MVYNWTKANFVSRWEQHHPGNLGSLLKEGKGLKLPESIIQSFSEQQFIPCTPQGLETLAGFWTYQYMDGNLHSAIS